MEDKKGGSLKNSIKRERKSLLPVEKLETKESLRNVSRKESKSGATGTEKGSRRTSTRGESSKKRK